MNDQKPSRFFGRYVEYRRAIKTEMESSTDITPWDPPVVSEGVQLEAERRRPYRAMNIESDFVVPVLQSIAAGVLGVLLSAYLTWYFDGAYHFTCFVGLVVSAVFFLATMSLNRNLLWVVERITNYDIDGDGDVGEPRVLAPVEVVRRNEAGTLETLFRLDLPDIPDADLATFAQGIVAGKSLSESTWTGGGNLFSKAQYAHLMGELERAGLVEWVNRDAKAQGRRLTAQGREAMLQIAN